MFEIFFTNRAEKALKTLDHKISKKVIEAINSLEYTYFPKPYDIKKLKGMENTYRIRIGDYRMLYRVDFEKKTIYILSILLRKQAYKK